MILKIPNILPEECFFCTISYISLISMNEIQVFNINRTIGHFDECTEQV